MKSTIIILMLVGLTIGQTEKDNPWNIKKDSFCSSVKDSCNSEHDKTVLPKLCSAKYSGINRLFNEFENLLFENLRTSYQYLLMSVNFANYEKNREGFAKLFKKMSDETWEDSIDLVKYITKRGGTLNFDSLSASNYEGINRPKIVTFDYPELESMSLALDMHKSLANVAHFVHKKASLGSKADHDAEAVSYIEKEFAHKHAQDVRTLSGYTNDLFNLIKHNKNDDPSLQLFLFDEYLLKTV